MDNRVTIYTQLQENTERLLEVGTFDCIYAKRYVKFNETDEQVPAEDNHYKEGIGLIQSALSYVSNPTPVIKQSLVSYSIN